MNKIESFFVSKVGVSFFKVFMLLLTLFCLWGFAHGLLDVLNKYFESLLQSNASKFVYLLLTYYAGYFLMPIPASMFAERYGYKNGIILGLLLFALGSFMFFPTSQFHSFPLFIVSMFSIALGMATLETVVNPYATLVGKNKYSTFRITLGHSFTSLGWFIGPFVGGNILMDLHKQNASEFSLIAVPYVGVGILVLFIAILFLISDLPKVVESRSEQLKKSIKTNQQPVRSIFKQRHFVGAVIAMAFYVAGQTALFGIYKKYLVELFRLMETHTVLGQEYLLKIVQVLGNSTVMDDKLYLAVAGLIYSFIGFGLFSVGRFFGSFLLIRLKPNKLLIISSLFSLFFSILLSLNLGIVSFIALCLMTLSISTMFPIIFSLGIRKMGIKTKRASACIIMGITGGCSFPVLISVFNMIDPISIGLAMLIVSFVVIFIYGYWGYKIDSKTRLSLKVIDEQL